jgi:hypothetical protein
MSERRRENNVVDSTVPWVRPEGVSFGVEVESVGGQ